MLKPADLAARPDFEAGVLLVSPARRIVRGPQGEIHLEPRIMQVFLLLIDAGGRVVTRNEIFDQCWGGAMVGDDSVNRAIAGVRRIATEVAPGAFEVETIPRTGYRMIGPMLAGMDAEAPSTAVSRRRVVGIGLATAAVATGGGAWWLMRGSGAKRVDELVDRADQMLRHGQPATQEQQQQPAEALLRQAVAAEPGNSRALGLLAYSLADGIEGDVTTAKPAVLEASRRAAAAALALNPRESNALLARSMLEHSFRDWAETDLGLRRVLQVDGRNTFAMARLTALLQAAGLNQESWEWNERAIAVDPVSPTHQFRRALKHWILGRVAQADVTIDRLLPLWPDHAFVWQARFLIYAFTDRTHAALAMIEDEKKRPPTLTPLAVSTWRLSLAALTERTPATIARAREAIRAAGRQAPGLAAYGIMILSELGEVDSAFAVAEGFLLSRGAAFTRQPASTRGLVNSTAWRSTQWLFTPPGAPMRADPRFEALCAGIGLTEYWRKRGVQPDYLR